MSRTSIVALAVAVAALAASFLASSRGASAGDGTSHRIVYLFVSGSGPQAKAWYDGGPPAGVQVQTALDKFAQDGFKFAALTASGRPPVAVVGATAPTIRSEDLPSDYVILLER